MEGLLRVLIFVSLFKEAMYKNHRQPLGGCVLRPDRPRVRSEYANASRIPANGIVKAVWCKPLITLPFRLTKGVWVFYVYKKCVCKINMKCMFRHSIITNVLKKYIFNQ